MLVRTIQAKRMEVVIFTTIIKTTCSEQAHVSTTLLPNISFKMFAYYYPYIAEKEMVDWSASIVKEI